MDLLTDPYPEAYQAAFREGRVCRLSGADAVAEGDGPPPLPGTLPHAVAVHPPLATAAGWQTQALTARCGCSRYTCLLSAVPACHSVNMLVSRDTAWHAAACCRRAPAACHRRQLAHTGALFWRTGWGCIVSTWKMRM